MPLTVQQTQLAETIDTHVRQVLAHGGGDEALLLSLADYMPPLSSCWIRAPARRWICSATGMTASTALRNCWRCWPRALLMAASLSRSDDAVRDGRMP